MNAFGYIVLLIVIVVIAFLLRKARAENSQSCEVKPYIFPVKKDAPTPTSTPVKKTVRKTAKKVVKKAVK